LQVVSACLGLLRGSHDRSRLPAAQLLLLLSKQPALVPRLEPCCSTLLALLADSGTPCSAGATLFFGSLHFCLLLTLQAPSDMEWKSYL
jgi:hypothetical protein